MSVSGSTRGAYAPISPIFPEIETTRGGIGTLGNTIIGERNSPVTSVGIQKKIQEVKGHKQLLIAIAVALVALIFLCSIITFVLTGGVSIIPFVIVGVFALGLLSGALMNHREQNSLEKNLAALKQKESI